MDLRLAKSFRIAAARYKGAGWVPEQARSMARKLAGSLRRRADAKSFGWSMARGLADVEGTVWDHVVRLEAPLVLISQAQRSGGSLLSQLLDGHPRLAVYPQELRIAAPSGERWPAPYAGQSSEEAFRSLFDLKFPRMMLRGLKKGDGSAERHRFLLVPAVQRGLFRRCYEEKPPASRRELLNCYFTAFFNAWLDYQGRLAEKSRIVAFSPRLANDEADMAAFREAYPDGYLVQVIRDPSTWFPSAKRHRLAVRTGQSDDDIIGTWRESAAAMLRNKKALGERAIVLRFEDILCDTEATMRRLADRLGVDFDQALLEPTFNGQPIRANSSFEVAERGVSRAPLERRSALTEEERRRVDTACRELYRQVIEIAEPIAGSGKGALSSTTELAMVRQ